jgi:PRTRC genetic system protein A
MSDDVFSQLFSNNSEQVKIGGFPDGDYCFGVFSNGLFERENVPFIGEFITLKTPIMIPSIPAGDNSFTPSFIHIPCGILIETIEFYRKVMKTIKSEVMTMIVYDTVLNDYKIVVPVQSVSGATVSYKQVQFGEHEKYIMACHSHVDMDAFFSGTDNNDEKRAMLYGVIGKLSQQTPAMKFRAKKGNIASELPVDIVFDFSDKRKYSIPECEILKISQRQYHAQIQTDFAQSWNYRNPNSPTTVYDYRKKIDNSLLDKYEDDENYFYQNPGWYGYQANKNGGFSKRTKEHNDIEFLDPDVSMAVDAFVRVYSDYAEKNFTLELSEDEIQDYYLEVANKLCGLIDCLDVNTDFHEMFAEIYLEGSAEFVEEEDDQTLEAKDRTPLSLIESTKALI